MSKTKNAAPDLLTEGIVSCTPKRLAHKDLHAAAKTAIEQNPANKPRIVGLYEIEKKVDVPQAIALLTTKYWGTGGVKLGVSFMEKTDQALRDLIIQHMNAWSDYANVTFAYSQSGGEVRISRGGGGYWSYLGTDILHIPKGQQTMNLEGFVLKTPLSEYKRVIRHETGHTLGFPHEHMRKEIVGLLDPAKTIAYFERTQGWSQQEIQDQVLTPIDDATITGTPTDVNSIMCYQLPGEITISGQPIPGGLDIDPSDGAFAGKIYPKAQGPVVPPTPPGPSNPPPTGAGVVTIDTTAKKITFPKGWASSQV